MVETSVYLHVPFCRHRCSYCDFNTYAGISSLIPDYVAALCREIELVSQSAGERLPVKTIFFGGGTPSLLPLSELEKIFSTLKQSFNLRECKEITLEANPGTVSMDYLAGLRSLGCDRISLGMQSANSAELRLLEREHEFSEVVQAVSWARQARFDNLNLDLIYGIPYQTMHNWQENLDLALELNPTHLSLYALTLEHGTPMQHQNEKGLLSDPDPDLAADMYEYASSRLYEAGFIQYEISNWALPDEGGSPRACLHNMQYWRNLPYLGLGAGAHGYADRFRTANVLSPAVYIQRCLDGAVKSFPRTPATVDATAIDRSTQIAETMMMGLRLLQEGISRTTFRERFRESLEVRFRDQIDRLQTQGLLEWAGRDGDILRLTQQGRLLGNRVFVEFI
jgi:oxygen-independent coproporphyrinogen III oxidase